MLKVDFKKRLADDKCFVCGKTFEKGDEIREIFDKAFGQNVRIHKKHYFFAGDEGLCRTQA